MLDESFVAKIPKYTNSVGFNWRAPVLKASCSKAFDFATILEGLTTPSESRGGNNGFIIKLTKGNGKGEGVIPEGEAV